MGMILLRAAIAAAIIVTVSEISNRHPRVGALLLSLPVISIVAFAMAWTQHRDLESISKLSRETLVLVPLGLPFFLPLAFAGRFGLGFWTAFGLGVVLASACLGGWLWVRSS